MESEHNLKLTNEFAKGYDDYIADKSWAGPEIIFNLLKPFINKGELLLDLGIGTGCASVIFNNAGLKIFGIDGSVEMIRICSQKKIVEELIVADIAASNFQLPDIEFNHVISNAVFHLVGNLEQIFKEVSIRLKANGYFCFTTFPFNDSENKNFNKAGRPGIFSKQKDGNSPIVFRHTYEYIEKELSKNGMKIISNLIFKGFHDKTENTEVFFEVYLSQK